MIAYRPRGQLFAQARCAHCRHAALYPAYPSPGPGTDPLLGLPLYLTATIGSDLLWVYNIDHIDIVATWLAAGLRERSITRHRMTMLARLPRWMKQASARARVLRALAELRAQAIREGLS